MARSTVAVFEARRKLLDEEIAALSDEHENIEKLITQLQRRKELLDGRWELLMAERDVLDERIWAHEPRMQQVPRPPQVSASPTRPRDLAPEPWDFALEGVLTH
ncbi:MAG: hypothetical protein KDK70_35610 [Myxococcales bacterium]|nr:hypothetical protein [Myxococcales bacterium]